MDDDDRLVKSIKIGIDKAKVLSMYSFLSQSNNEFNMLLSLPILLLDNLSLFEYELALLVLL